ncbi:MAG: hypothetical protein CIT01_00100 [Methanobacterium sp. BRmetb2]|nr:MAG: hypothetical protein CIT01_00100 [Methanobacterium sp. BRmetb2]
MMFGLNESFDYLECSSCGCLQIIDIPVNMDKYYPSNYYSLQRAKSQNIITNLKKNIIEILGKERNKYVIFKKGMIGKFIYKNYPNSLFDPTKIFDKVGKIDINLDSKVLDVGCGHGDFLYKLNRIGFKSLTGIDPYVNNEYRSKQLKILRRSIDDFNSKNKFDLINFNDSFEHLSSQLKTLLKVSEILSEGGICLIRMPIKTEYIWSRYGVNWVQIDAPRHFLIHTLNSFDVLVQKTGLNIVDTIFDSTEFQFWGSEQYKRNITLLDGNMTPNMEIFTKDQIKVFKRHAQELNEKKLGDEACFYLSNP